MSVSASGSLSLSQPAAEVTKTDTPLAGQTLAAVGGLGKNAAEFAELKG